MEIATMHDMSKETFLRPDQLKRGVEIELTQRPEWGTAFIRGRVQGKPQLWDVSKSMDKRGRFIDEDELLQHWRTPNMSNTRKEIAARLGFAAGNGAKMAFAPQIDEAEQELKAWTKKLGYYPDMAKVNIRPNTVMLWFYDQKGKATQLASKLRSVAASMNLSPSAITSEEGRHPAYDGGAARDVGQVTVDYNRSTKSSRPGAKAKFEISSYEQAEYQIALSEERIASYRKALANTEAMIRNANSLMRTADSGDKKAMKEVIGIARMLESTMKSRGFSRPGTKTSMTREQTEEQKAGLKIMSAADPAVGEKIATLIKEGKPQDQAVAIALDMKRRGEI